MVNQGLKKAESGSPGEAAFRAGQVTFNPLSLKSDQHQISPCNINALLNRVVMRITDMITEGEFV